MLLIILVILSLIITAFIGLIPSVILLGTGFIIAKNLPNLTKQVESAKNQLASRTGWFGGSGKIGAYGSNGASNFRLS